MNIVIKPAGTKTEVAGSTILLPETGILWVGDEIWVSQKTFDLYVKQYKR